MHSADTAAEWLTRSDPLNVFAWLTATVMLIIALAQWLASYRVDRRALRIFAFRYAAASLGWWLAHPGRIQSGQAIPIGSALVGVALLGVTVWALHEFLGRASARRRAGIAAGSLVAAIAVALYRQWQHNDPAAIYIVMIVAMSLCAVMAWRASRHEPNVGHAYVAAAFASYPVVMLGAALLGWDARSNLSYVVALPSAIVGITILFVNLLANALRFATGGGRAPTVRIGSAAPQAGEGPAIFVEDNGPGFPPEAAGRLFEPFGRLHEGTLSQHGIGLSIVRRIVERHGGRVWADSRPGQGAVFWFALPAGA